MRPLIPVFQLVQVNTAKYTPIIPGPVTIEQKKERRYDASLKIK
jgi:hypothetical protein